VKEKDYYPIIESFFKSKGYLTFIEYRFLRGIVIPDILAIDPTLTRVVSVEVKRKDFKKALYQGFSYLAFSDYVYLAFPEKYAYHVIRKYIRPIKKLGFGILALNPNPKELIKPETSKYLSEELKQKLLCELRHRERP